jgi:hypothetical protein
MNNTSNKQLLNLKAFLVLLILSIGLIIGLREIYRGYLNDLNQNICPNLVSKEIIKDHFLDDKSFGKESHDGFSFEDGCIMRNRYSSDSTMGEFMILQDFDLTVYPSDIDLIKELVLSNNEYTITTKDIDNKTLILFFHGIDHKLYYQLPNKSYLKLNAVSNYFFENSDDPEVIIDSMNNFIKKVDLGKLSNIYSDWRYSLKFMSKFPFEKIY